MKTAIGSGVHPRGSVGISAVVRTALRLARHPLHAGLALGRMLRDLCRMRTAEPEDLLSYLPATAKILEGVLLLLEEAGNEGVTSRDILKVAFIADKAHLDAHGRPVTFDNYVATEAGPAGLAVSGMLAPTFDWSALDLGQAPWEVIHEATGEPSLARPARRPDLRLLSETDVEALRSAHALVRTLGEKQLRRFTHRNAAYTAAWDSGGGEGRRLDPRLVAERRNDDLIEDLLYMSRFAA